MGKRSLVSVVDDDESVRESLPAGTATRRSVRACSRGAAECLFKPFSEAALLDALHAALGMVEADRASTGFR